MTMLNKSLILLVFLLSGCKLCENLDDRYTKETPIPAHVRNSDVCLSIPVQNDEVIASALAYNVKKPSEQVIFPAGKQLSSGLFCIGPKEFKFENGQEYLAYIEVNIKEGGQGKKSTRKAYVSTFQVVQEDDRINIIQISHQ